MSRPNHPAHLPGLDLLRATAIVWVMAYHLVSHGPRLPGIADLGWMGVDLFFVLSGFLIGGQIFAVCARPGGVRWSDYVLRRALRVLPAYWAVLALYLWLPAWRESPGLAPAWQFLTFTSNLFADYPRHAAFSHAWSLCVEEHFYLLLPLVVIVLARRPSLRKGALFCVGLLAAGMLLRWWVWDAQVRPYLHVTAGDDMFLVRWVEHIYNPTYARLDGLLAGCALAAVKQFRPAWWGWMTARGWAFTASGIACVAAASLLFRDPVGVSASVAGFPLLSLGLGAVLVGMAGPHTLPGRVAVPGARQLATLAFSLYLTHKAVYHLVDTYAGAAFGGSNLMALAGYNATALLAASLLYLAVERPGLRLRARLLGEGRRVDAASSLPPLTPR
jgi:peptidoglycan/LPS O-acetylase OafA/YrhL